MGLTSIPSDVFSDNTRYNKAPVDVDTGSSHQAGTVLYVVIIVEPQICDVVRVAFGLTVQLHPAALEGCGVDGRQNDV